MNSSLKMRYVPWKGRKDQLQVKQALLPNEKSYETVFTPSTGTRCRVFETSVRGNPLS